MEALAAYLLAGVLVPLYPFSILPNALLARLRCPLLKALMLPAWALLGVFVLTRPGVAPPEAVVWWGALSALLYALRLLTVRDISLWTGFALSSALALLWVWFGAANASPDSGRLALFALAFAVPLAILQLLSARLVQLFGAAHIGLYRGLGVTMPRFAALFVAAALAAVATPLFPSFTAFIGTLLAAPTALVVVMLLVWLLWSWAAVNLLRGVVFGAPAADAPAVDLSRSSALAYAAALSALAAGGIYLMGYAL